MQALSAIFRLRFPLLLLLSLSPAISAQARTLVLTSVSLLRYPKSEVLESLGQLPEGAKIEIPPNSAPEFIPYRDENGTVQRSTNGFHGGLKILSVPEAFQATIPPAKIAEWNRTAGGIYLPSEAINSSFDPSSTIPALSKAGLPGSGFLKVFDPSGKRRSNPYAARLRKRFGSQFNRAISWSSMAPEERTKWEAIQREMAAVADRTRETLRKELFLDSGSAKRDIELAAQYSQDFENTGRIQTYGAWNIATQGTAVRHGFPNVPCAEFMSEIVRQSYEKAGHKVTDDFKGTNSLIWTHTADVVSLATALASAGWIPWDPAQFKPQAGAIGMNALADSPGHSYLIGGEGGRFLVDNGSPYGRDLYTTQEKYITMMYDLGTFFLPPGVIPESW